MFVLMETDDQIIYLSKAEECIAGAQSEFVNSRFNNCANRCYYATFHAAIAALISSSIRPSGSQWGHDFVQPQFNGQLINRRKVFPTVLRNTLEQNYRLHELAHDR